MVPPLRDMVSHIFQLGTEMHCELVGSNLHGKLAVM